jgi:hypothetical protein
MKKFKLNFRNRSVLEQIATCRRVADCLSKQPTRNRAALDKNPVATIVAEAVEAQARVEALRLELRSALSDRHVKVRAARAAVTRAAMFVSSETRGDAAGLLAAGLEIESAKRPVGRPSAPEQLRATATEFEGVVQLRWKRPVRRCAFLVQMTRDPAAADGWKQVTVSIRQSCEVTGLASGEKHWFRVAATNTQGQGPWTGPVGVRPA